MEENIFNARQGVRKRRSQWIAFGVFKLLSYSIVLILFCILGFIIYKGIGVINWKFLTSPPSDGMTGGGIWPAIVGTFYLMIGSALFAFPVVRATVEEFTLKTEMLILMARKYYGQKTLLRTIDILLEGSYETARG